MDLLTRLRGGPRGSCRTVEGSEHPARQDGAYRLRSPARGFIGAPADAKASGAPAEQGGGTGEARAPVRPDGASERSAGWRARAGRKRRLPFAVGGRGRGGAGCDSAAATPSDARGNGTRTSARRLRRRVLSGGAGDVRVRDGAKLSRDDLQEAIRARPGRDTSAFRPGDGTLGGGVKQMEMRLLNERHGQRRSRAPSMRLK